MIGQEQFDFADPPQPISGVPPHSAGTSLCRAPDLSAQRKNPNDKFVAAVQGVNFDTQPKNRTGLSKNTVRKYLRADSVEPRFNVADRASKLDPYADKLSAMPRVETGTSRKKKRTVK